MADSTSDPRNDEDYDTWEYGTEPIPQDHTWTESNDAIPEDLKKEWEYYNACCDALDIPPNIRRFLKYNELYPPEEYK